ncbi:DNA damage-regulated autophagy modulator protein 2 isoform X2 [Nematostella vectensis]|nr:DNA damage-regulated autophagy modulator protein 2 isoform X2 [Nematostella vectensis]XP_032231039.1 DNA damage-regulated autophagy modulator protein 2 isoform X2 [Nematostella vectensis]
MAFNPLSSLHFLPITLGLLAVIAFFTAYGMAVYYGHVDALFPYISDAGSRVPESCIFGQFLNLAAFVAFAAMYIHYKHIKEFNITSMPLVKKLNNISIWLSAFTCLGLSMVANFQYTSISVPHFIGAFLVFGLGILYCWIQSVISYKMKNQGMSTALTAFTRFALSFASTIFFLITLIGAGVANSEWKSAHGSRNITGNTTITPTTPLDSWTSDQSGYDSHLASTFSEWLMGFSFLLFFMTYYREFKKITIAIKVVPKEAEVFSPSSDDVIGIVA